MTKIDFSATFTAAHDACENASRAELAEHGDHGACGFAYVVIDGRAPFAKWCRNQITVAKDAGVTNPLFLNKYGDKGYPKGYEFFIRGIEGTQTLAIREAGARAFIAVLEKAGIPAHMRSNLD